jgi:hypothetical protein
MELIQPKRVNAIYDIISKRGWEWRLITYKLYGQYHMDIERFNSITQKWDFDKSKRLDTKQELFKLVKLANDYLYHNDLF